MPNKMLIDASHPEETRVVVVRGSRIEEFDFESQDKKQLKGNIYLARVTRVEPSLQAAFVEYGGNRHGFLAFSEIHPDYYQIPVADRQALLRAEAEAAEAEDEEEEEERRGGRRRRRGRNRGGDRHQSRASGEEAGDDEASSEASSDDASHDAHGGDGEHAEAFHEDEAAGEADDHASDDHSSDDHAGDEASSSMAHEAGGDVVSEPLPVNGDLEEVNGSGSEPHDVESVGADDAVEEVRTRRRAPRRQYKIQEVIKRRQILLVQVVKEERGNKGAALTTYLSLAGRYSVLMPNTARGGGISRKITNATDRKRLKDVVKDLEVPQGMGVILRTAGESRTKAEIKRDYEYLMRLWENVRSLTLQSTAPALVYEEGSLIKRSVRDLYNKDIDEIQVAGDDGYREAKDFMRMLMPSHAKVVQPYKDNVPLFVRYGVESQLDKMLQPQVTLKSGGYLIINQTEALVAIDVNSGRSTREHSIEDTALQTNLEAAEEVARQLRLRDMAGLIVIDFIDMEENRNNRSVEKRLKDHLKNDRARIQVGRISHFGLLEMSRQRIRASVLESTMQPCPHCGGTGHVRSESSVALLVLRAIEEFLLKDSRFHITVRTPASTALYVLNHKRSNLADLERRFGLTITIEVDENVGATHYAISKAAVVERPANAPAAPVIEPPALEPEDDEDEVVAEAEDEDEETAPRSAAEDAGRSEQHGDQPRKRRRRRRRRGRDRDREDGQHGHTETPAAHAGDGEDAHEDEGEAVEGDDEAGEQDAAASASQADADAQGKRRRRGKRGGRRNRRDEAEGEGFAEAGETEAFDHEPAAVQALDVQVTAEASVLGADAEPEAVEAQPAPVAEEPAAPAAKPARRSRKKAEPAAETGEAAAEAAPKPARRSRKKTEPAAETGEVGAEPAAPEPVAQAPEPAPEPARKAAPAEPVVTVSGAEAQPDEQATDKPRKAGWWQRKSFF
ncbi:MAG: Rne/Rng family ribonuclease [Rhizobiales bacterium]|nr:Rne/Rng family ribonuclease [Hyphomicrobiales bacterium]